MKIVGMLDLAREERGKAPFKLVFTTCVVAVAVAMSSPGFQANPLLDKTVGKIRQHLPATFDTITRALGGG
jgi:hypothetical protein